jgi:hypothetical protein
MIRTASGNTTLALDLTSTEQHASSAISDIINRTNNHTCFAQVTFRVRCESVGYGEEIFLMEDHPSNDNSAGNALHPNSTVTHQSGKVHTL